MTQFKRTPTYPISPILLNRHSPRAMSGESFSEEELMTLFEAARWAPSSYNNQPWRFIYARRETLFWELLFDLLVPFNQRWVKNGAVLCVVISLKTSEKNGKPSTTHSFDAGMAFENLALQGSINGWVVHAMEGFDYDKAAISLNLPKDYQVEAMFVAGKKGSIQELDEDIRAKEVLSDRKPLKELIQEGSF